MFRQDFINNVFNEVVDKYDLMNDLMSMGVHRIWKNNLVSLIDNLDSKIMDLACGSGDITSKIYKQAVKSGSNPEIYAVDVCQKMLNKAKEKMINQNITNVNFVHSDATNLDFADETFDYILISYGIRNVENIEQALVECHRVLKKGGKFFCLEFSQVNPSCIRNLYSVCSKFIPKIGKFVAKNEAAYDYLVKSIQNFKDPITLLNMIKQSGFYTCNFDKLGFGISCIHKAVK